MYLASTGPTLRQPPPLKFEEEPDTCPTCLGKKFVDGKLCPTCGGSGDTDRLPLSHCRTCGTLHKGGTVDCQSCIHTESLMW